MILKKNGKIFTTVISFGLIGWYIGSLNKSSMNKNIMFSKLSLENYMNRLKEFDMSPEQEATNLFLDLIESGFHPNSAFDVVKKECLEAGEKFND